MGLELYSKQYTTYLLLFVEHLGVHGTLVIMFVSYGQVLYCTYVRYVQRTLATGSSISIIVCLVEHSDYYYMLWGAIRYYTEL